jgi:hypothetical protein
MDEFMQRNMVAPLKTTPTSMTLLTRARQQCQMLDIELSYILLSAAFLLKRCLEEQESTQMAKSTAQET